MNPNVHCSTIYNSKGVEATCMSIHRRMDKEDVVHTYNGILLSHKKNKIMPFAATWMELENLIQSEMRQKDKDKYHMISGKVLMGLMLQHEKGKTSNRFP